MARTYLFHLFVFFIVSALRLDSNEAVFPPPNFPSLCLLAIEGNQIGGLWRYDPDEEVIQGIPTMFKLNLEANETDKTRVYNDSNIDRGYSLVVSGGAIKFPQVSCVLPYGLKHPCMINAADQSFWRIVEDTADAFLKGYAQVTNEIVNVECVPEHGGLTNALRYDLPEYDGFKTVYSCVTWLKEIEASSGVKSSATAVEVVVETEKCTLYYEDHISLSESGGDNNYCFLAPVLPVSFFPGFYIGCRVYVEHVLFHGLWELDYETDFDSMPYMRRRRATQDDPFSSEVTLHDGFDDASGRLDNTTKLFRLLNHGRSEYLSMKWHICMGPNIDAYVRGNNDYWGPYTLYRYDKGLDCIPFLFDASYFGRFLGYTSATLDVYHTLGSCTQYFNAEFPLAEWKVVLSILDVGPCVAFGGGTDYSFLARPIRPEPVFSCFSTKFHITFHPAPSCLYAVEAGMYSGYFPVDLLWTNEYSHYPILSKRRFLGDTYLVLKWENGYRLKGLDEEYLVGLGDVNICPDEWSYQIVPVTYNDNEVGTVYRSDDARVCEPSHVQIMPNSDNPGLNFDTYSSVTSLMDCMTQAKARREHVHWKAYVRQGSVCQAYGERLDINNISLVESASDSETYSCIDQENSDFTRPILNLEESCAISVEGSEYCGNYNLDLSFENNYGSYPMMKRKTIELTNGRIIDQESDAFIKAENTAGGLVLTLFGLTVEYRILVSGHMCESSHDYGTKFWVVDETEERIGDVYKLDPNADSCESLPGVRTGSDDSHATSIDLDGSFSDCRQKLSVIAPKTMLKGLVKTGGSCKALDDSLDTRDVTRKSNQEGCTCVFPERFFPTPRLRDVNRGCMAIVKEPVFHGLYAVKNYVNTNDFPLVVAQKIVREYKSLIVGGFYNPSERGYRYIEYSSLNDKQKLKTNSDTTRDIMSRHGFLCFGAYQEPEPIFPVKNNDTTTGNVQRYSGTVSLEILDSTNATQMKLVKEQGIECPGTEVVICSYGEQKMVTCLEII